MSFLSCRKAVVFACLAGTSVAWGQRLSWGVEGGAVLTEPTRLREEESKRYVVGGTVEYQVWRGFTAEADFLYRHYGSTARFVFGPSSSFMDGFVSVTDRARLDVFELPVLGKYYFRNHSKLQPFVLTGYSFRKVLANTASELTTTHNGVLSRERFDSSSWAPLDVGASFGAGLKWRAGRVSILPQIRYTRWGSQPSAGLSKQQADVLVGITF